MSELIAALQSISAQPYYRPAESERVLPPRAAIKDSMDTATLLPDPEATHLHCIRPSINVITLIVKTTTPLAECPPCHRRSARLHSPSRRRINDLRWHGVTVKLELHTRRFRCRNSLCPRRIFC